GGARDPLLSDIAAQAARLPMPLEPLDDLGALAVSDKWPVNVPDKTDIDLAARVRNREKIPWVQGMWHLDDAAMFTFSVQIIGGGDWQLAAHKFGSNFPNEADLFVKQIVFIADENDQGRAPAVEPVRAA